MSQNNYVIYKFTSPSGKSYIGQTNDLNRRIRQHKSKSGCTAFSSAIKKYGFSAFTQTILMSGLTLNEANFWEKEFIGKFNTISPNGYNLTNGGDNFEFSEISRKKMSVSQLAYFKNDSARKRVSDSSKKMWSSDEFKESWIKKSKDRFANNPGLRVMAAIKTKNHFENNPDARVKASEKTKAFFSDENNCKKHSEILKVAKSTEQARKNSSEAQKIVMSKKENRERHSIAMKQHYANNPEARRKNAEKGQRPVICITTGEQFKSIKDAAIKTGCHESGVGNCCRGKSKQTKGLVFGYQAAIAEIKSYAGIE